MNMSGSGIHLNALLDKMTSSDKDFRFMAVNDLMSELNKDSIKLDCDSERKVVQMLLKLLEDKNIEVQNLSVKCLAPLISRVKDQQLDLITETLCIHMLSPKEQMRDIASIGLKSLISELHSSTSVTMVESITQKITDRLISAINSDDVFVKLEALDILANLINKFGPSLNKFHPQILEVLKPQLTNARLAIRKRTIVAIGYLVMSCNDAIFMNVMTYILEQLNANENLHTTSACVQCVSAIWLAYVTTKQAGHKLGEQIESLLPHIVRFSKPGQDVDDELREFCLQAFESFVNKCPKHISPHINLISSICIECINYDPNYNYDNDNDLEMEDELDITIYGKPLSSRYATIYTKTLVNSEDSEDDDAYSDDDDVSWKVRRSSAKTIQSIILARHDLLIDFYENLSLPLIECFKEREENVKTDIFNAYMAILKQTKQLTTMNNKLVTLDNDNSPFLKMLSDQISTIVNATYRMLRLKPIKPRICVFSLLSELCSILPGCLDQHISVIMPGVIFSLSEKSTNSNIKIETLLFMNTFLSSHSPQLFHPFIDQIVTIVTQCISDPFYKVSSEALQVTEALVLVIRPNIEDSAAAFDYHPYVMRIYNATEQCLKISDIDQDLKEHAISCVAQIIYSFGDCLNNELNICLPIILNRLYNEITRFSAVKALTLISRSPLKIDLCPILKDAIPQLASFLRKNQRALRLSTVLCLDYIIQNYGKSMLEDMFREIIHELPPLLSESDLHISQLTLNLLTSICKIRPKTIDVKSREAILPQTLTLVLSPLLQGEALISLSLFYQALSVSDINGLDYFKLRMYITSIIDQPNSKSTFVVHKQAFQSIAKCLASMMMKISKGNNSCVGDFIDCIKNESSNESERLLSTLTVAEIGCNIDLSGYPNLQDIIMNQFNSKYEEIKTAASYAIGRITVGNLSVLLPSVLNAIHSQKKHQYLLLHSLRETIACSLECHVPLDKYINPIWVLLLNYSNSPEEGIRNVVSECLGCLCLMEPILLTELVKCIENASPLEKSTIVTSVKFTISDQPKSIDSNLKKCMPAFLDLLCDDDLNVKRSSLIALNSTVHNKPSLIRSLLNTVLPNLYRETNIRKELIREVEMGPFKHTVDDGLDIRKAAFECMYTLLETCLSQIDIHEFMKHVLKGLCDHYDIKMLTHLMLIRLVYLCPDAIIQFLDNIIEALRNTCAHKVKQNSVKQEYEKQEELKRSALRAFSTVLKVPTTGKSMHIKDFIEYIRKHQELNSMFDSILKDVNQITTTTEPMEICGAVKSARYR